MAGTSTDARFWNRAARKYAASPIADVAGYERSVERARHYLKHDGVVFEFGCGTGTTALKLASSVARIDATDISSEMVAIAREKAAAEGVANVAFALGDPATWGGGPYDAVLGFNILHLIEDRTAALANVHRLLKPGGVFISKTPCLGEMSFLLRGVVPLMRALGQAPYVAFFTGAALEREIEGAGFEIVERARHGARGKERRVFLAAEKR